MIVSRSGYGLVRVAFLLIGGYGVFVVFLFSWQARLLYYPNQPSRELTSTPADIGLAYQSVELTSTDGLHIHGWFLPAAEARGVVLFCHGNAGNISHRLESLKIFHDLGLAVLIFDYQGFGQSQGKPSEQGTYDDVEAAWNYLTQERGIPAKDIVIFGRSLGAAIAAQLASRHQTGGLILESGFTSVPDLAATLYPFIPVRWLVRFSYNTRDYLNAVSSPVLVIHSRDDELIPFAHGRELFAAAKAPKQFLELRGGHNDGFLLSGQTYIDGLAAFLSFTH